LKLLEEKFPGFVKSDQILLPLLADRMKMKTSG